MTPSLEQIRTEGPSWYGPKAPPLYRELESLVPLASKKERAKAPEKVADYERARYVLSGKDGIWSTPDGSIPRNPIKMWTGTLDDRIEYFEDSLPPLREEVEAEMFLKNFPNEISWLDDDIGVSLKNLQELPQEEIKKNLPILERLRDGGFWHRPADQEATQKHIEENIGNKHKNLEKTLKGYTGATIGSTVGSLAGLPGAIGLGIMGDEAQSLWEKASTENLNGTTYIGDTPWSTPAPDGESSDASTWTDRQLMKFIEDHGGPLPVEESYPEVIKEARLRFNSGEYMPERRRVKTPYSGGRSIVQRVEDGDLLE